MTNQKHGMSPVAAAVTGAVVGAGVAVAGAVVLKDKKNREKFQKVFENAKDQAVGYMEDMKDKAQRTQKEVGAKVKSVSKSVKKKA